MVCDEGINSCLFRARSQAHVIRPLEVGTLFTWKVGQGIYHCLF